MSKDEFDVIRALFAPLARSDAARGLIDDVALFQARGALVLTTDAIVEGVHFLADDPLDTVAQKALRVNVSDIAAKGAKPVGALLTLIWPDDRPATQIEAFARGLRSDLDAFGVTLLGGDTTATQGPLTVSITLLGEPLGDRTPSRADAREGQDVWVTGALGDAWLGYMCLTGGWAPAAESDAAAVVGRYRTPSPPLKFAPVIARHARASMDLSDGLLADAEKMARASGRALILHADALPISPAGQGWVAEHRSFGRLFNWGDDYEALFTADQASRSEIESAAVRERVVVTRIGRVYPGEGVRVLDREGREIMFAEQGHAHQLGR